MSLLLKSASNSARKRQQRAAIAAREQRISEYPDLVAGIASRNRQSTQAREAARGKFEKVRKKHGLGSRQGLDAQRAFENVMWDNPYTPIPRPERSNQGSFSSLDQRAKSEQRRARSERNAEALKNRRRILSNQMHNTPGTPNSGQGVYNRGDATGADNKRKVTRRFGLPFSPNSHERPHSKKTERRDNTRVGVSIGENTSSRMTGKKSPKPVQAEVRSGGKTEHRSVNRPQYDKQGPSRLTVMKAEHKVGRDLRAKERRDNTFHGRAEKQKDINFFPKGEKKGWSTKKKLGAGALALAGTAAAAYGAKKLYDKYKKNDKGGQEKKASLMLIGAIK